MESGLSHQYVNLESTGSVHYVKAGQGPPLVLLHGLGVSVATWHNNFSAFASRYTVYAPDLPGHGDTDKPDIPYGLDVGVEFLPEFLDALGLDGNVTLMGNSAGGMVAVTSVLKQPERFRALVLISPVGLGRELGLPIRLASLPLIGKSLHKLDGKSKTRFVQRIFHDKSTLHPEAYRELIRVRSIPEARRTELGVIRRNVTFRGLRKSLVIPHHDLLDLPVPTLLVWGRQDKIIPVKHALHAAERYPAIEVRIFQDCGHWPQMEQSEAFNQAVLDFLDRVYSPERESALRDS